MFCVRLAIPADRAEIVGIENLKLLALTWMHWSLICDLISRYKEDVDFVLASEFSGGLTKLTDNRYKWIYKRWRCRFNVEKH